jgi:hypothetical protein
MATGPDTYFRAEQLAELDLSELRDLAIVGCGSGRPDEFVGDLTMAHAATVAGARQVLYTLWPIRPKLGAEFVDKLVRALAEGRPANASLAHLYQTQTLRASPFALMRP